MNFTLLNKTISITAKRNSGKSQLLRYLVSDAIEKNYYKKIFVICPTQSINGFYTDLIDSKNMFSSYDDEWIEKLMENMGKVNKGKNNETAQHVLLILDDVCSDIALHQSPTFKQLMTKGRHYFISVIITCQYINHVPPSCRANCDFILTGQLNNSNIDILTDEYMMGDIDKKTFLEMYRRLTKDYGFLLINNSSVKDDNLNSIYGQMKCPEEYIKN